MRTASIAKIFVYILCYDGQSIYILGILYRGDFVGNIVIFEQKCNFFFFFIIYYISLLLFSRLPTLTDRLPIINYSFRLAQLGNNNNNNMYETETIQKGAAFPIVLCNRNQFVRKYLRKLTMCHKQRFTPIRRDGVYIFLIRVTRVTIKHVCVCTKMQNSVNANAK